MDWRPEGRRASRARILFNISLKTNYKDEETYTSHNTDLTSSVRRQSPQPFPSCHQLLIYHSWEISEKCINLSP